MSAERSARELVVYEGPHFVAADKPGGWLCVPSRLGAADERPCLGRRLEQAFGVRLWPVHRLDEEVSGLVLFAKDAQAHRAANGWFETRAVAKEYEALTEGSVGDVEVGARVEWRSLLARGKRRAFVSPHGKEAVTAVVCEGEVAGALGFRLWPQTGRSHQLRVHLASHGFPILGDALYGSTRPFAGGIALRAVGLAFAEASSAEGLGLPAELRVSALFAHPTLDS